MRKLLFDEATHTYTLDGVKIPSVTDVCRFLSYDYKSDRPWMARQSADRGTRIHAACAAIDWGHDPEPDPEIDGYVTAYLRFLADYRPDWYGIEFSTYSEILQYPHWIAGTVDRFGTIDSPDGRDCCILDIKTGQLHPAYLSAQLTGYREILDFNKGLGKYTALYALQLSRDGTYKLVEVSYDPVLFNSCLTLHTSIDAERMKKK